MYIMLKLGKILRMQSRKRLLTVVVDKVFSELEDRLRKSLFVWVISIQAIGEKEIAI